MAEQDKSAKDDEKDDAQKGAEEQTDAEKKAPEDKTDADIEEVAAKADNPDAVRTALKAERDRAKAQKDRADGLEAEVKKFRDAAKTKEERDADAKADAERKAQDAGAEVLRLRAAIKYGLDEGDLDLLGTGTEDEIDARAKRLADRFSGAKNDEKDDDDETDVKRRPRERLRTGAASKTEPEKTDPKSLAAAVPRGPF